MVEVKLVLSAMLWSLMMPADRFAAFGQEVDSPPVVEVSVNTHGGGSEQEYFHEGDMLRVQVDAVADQDVFVYIVYHEAGGESTLLFPNVADRDNRVPAGVRRHIPDDSSGIAFRIRPPFGRESLAIISALRPLPELEQAIEESPGAIPTLTVDILNQLIEKWMAERALFDIHDKEFETRPEADHVRHSDGFSGQ
jgi:hypothetical protein